MTNRELLELAANAAGLEFMGLDPESGDLRLKGGAYWNPLDDDGDALRLAVRLGIQILYSDFTGLAEVKWNRGADRLTEYGPDDPDATTRLAITRAAAEIGKAKRPADSGKGEQT